MGYRFTVNQMNMVLHIVDGNFKSFLIDSLQSQESLNANLDYLINMSDNLETNFFTSTRYFRTVSSKISNVVRNLKLLKVDLEKRMRTYWQKEDFLVDKYLKELLLIDEVNELLEILIEFKKAIGRAKIKCILLPGFDNRNEINRKLISKKLLLKLINIHPEDSCLILQMEEIPQRKIFLYDSLKRFSSAMKNIDSWPGILLWNNKETIFISLAGTLDEAQSKLAVIFEAIHYNVPLKYIEEVILKHDSNFVYLLHLSDLHFGKFEANRRKNRLLQLIENQIKEIGSKVKIYPIITGDLLDSPNESNLDLYEDFIKLLKAKGTEEPIDTLGNHDVDNKGIGLSHLKKQKSVAISLNEKRIVEILEDAKLIIIRFNSNAGGDLAQGMIGERQLILIGNELDKIANIEQYNVIAILHHHPKTIVKPDWYKGHWYERILSSFHDDTMELKDAPTFLAWLRRRNINLVLHGHKHIPNVQRVDNINIIACGSSTGDVMHKESGKTHLSFNLIKYDLNEDKPVSCTTFYEEILGSGVHMKSVLL